MQVVNSGPFGNFMAALTIVFMVLPWHMEALRFLRDEWDDPYERRYALIVTSLVVPAMLKELLIDHEIDLGWFIFGCGAVYNLIQMWRNRKGPKGKWKKAATANLKAMADRIKVKIPSPALPQPA